MVPGRHCPPENQTCGVNQQGHFRISRDLCFRAVKEEPGLLGFSRQDPRRLILMWRLLVKFILRSVLFLFIVQSILLAAPPQKKTVTPPQKENRENTASHIQTGPASSRDELRESSWRGDGPERFSEDRCPYHRYMDETNPALHREIYNLSAIWGD